MLHVTHTDTKSTHTFVVLGVLALHGLALGLLLQPSAAPDLGTPPGIALEMVLPPAHQARPHAQPPSERQQTDRQQPVTRAPTASPKAAATSNAPQAAPSTPNATATTAASASVPPGTETTAAVSPNTRLAAANNGSPAFSLPSSEAQGLNNPKPTYPRLSRRLNEQGQVVVRVFVAADGSPQQGEIRTSSGYDRLDQEALRTVLRWRFVPGQRMGVPEAMWFNVPVHFVLD